jgi:uncharacterized protein
LTTLVPHALPYVLFVAIGAAIDVIGPWADVVRVVVAGAALVLFARRGAYAELRARPTVVGAAAGVAAGLVVAFAWVPLGELVPLLTAKGRTGLDPSTSLVLTAFRIADMTLVVPFAEELFVRSALPRLVDARPGEDWRARAVGAFTPLSGALSIGFFTVAHPEWLAALATALLWTALLARTRNLWTTIIAHAVANAGLATYVVVSGDTRWW